VSAHFRVRRGNNQNRNTIHMKLIITTLMSAAFAAFAAMPVIAADEAAAKLVTLEGTATCAKCDLETKKECQSVLQVEKDGKTETYVLAGKADEAWHKKVCKSSKQVKITGTVSEKDGEKVLTATDIEMVGKVKKADEKKADEKKKG
jgi:hypothetical protein